MKITSTLLALALYATPAFAQGTSTAEARWPWANVTVVDAGPPNSSLFVTPPDTVQTRGIEPTPQGLAKELSEQAKVIADLEERVSKAEKTIEDFAVFLFHGPTRKLETVTFPVPTLTNPACPEAKK